MAVSENERKNTTTELLEERCMHGYCRCCTEALGPGYEAPSATLLTTVLRGSRNMVGPTLDQTPAERDRDSIFVGIGGDHRRGRGYAAGCLGIICPSCSL